MTKNNPSADLDQAMQDALASVEKGEKQRAKAAAGATDDATVEVDAAGGAGASSERLQTLEAENGAMREQLLRLAADFDNFRKRSRREQDDARRFGIERLLADVLPVADNLDRALSHVDAASDAVIEGVRMVSKQMVDVLSTHGVKPFVSTGEKFDPERHEAVSQQESSEHAPGTVLHEMQRGYTLHDRLLRPARVTVTIAPQAKP